MKRVKLFDNASKPFEANERAMELAQTRGSAWKRAQDSGGEWKQVDTCVNKCNPMGTPEKAWGRAETCGAER